jgi:hypothetical protein
MIKFSKNLQIYFVLDENSETIKFYSLDMKVVRKYTPSKVKHGNTLPKIKAFDLN